MAEQKNVIILFDSWYTKKNLVCVVDEYLNLHLICIARYDSVIYDLAPQRSGKRSRPAKHGKRLFQTKIFDFPMIRLVIITSVYAGFSPTSSVTGKSLPT